MSEADKVLRSSEVGSRVVCHMCPQHLPLYFSLYHVLLQVGRMAQVQHVDKHTFAD